jgi:hypothetical protein
MHLHPCRADVQSRLRAKGHLSLAEFADSMFSQLLAQRSSEEWKKAREVRQRRGQEFAKKLQPEAPQAQRRMVVLGAFFSASRGIFPLCWVLTVD